jgi:hypothetical protein
MSARPQAVEAPTEPGRSSSKRRRDGFFARLAMDRGRVDRIVAVRRFGVVLSRRKRPSRRLDVKVV